MLAKTRNSPNSPNIIARQNLLIYSMLAATNISENTQFAKFAKYNSTPKFVDLQYQKDKNKGYTDVWQFL